MGSVAGEISILKDLKFKSTVSINYSSYNQLSYTPSYVDIGNYMGKTSSENGTGSQSHSTTLDIFFENTLTWDKEINENHRFNLLVGTSWEEHRSDFFSAAGKGYPDDKQLNQPEFCSSRIQSTGSYPGEPKFVIIILCQSKLRLEGSLPIHIHGTRRCIFQICPG